jgi:hypothetical protein
MLPDSAMGIKRIRLQRRGGIRGTENPETGKKGGKRQAGDGKAAFATCGLNPGAPGLKPAGSTGREAWRPAVEACRRNFL